MGQSCGSARVYFFIQFDCNDKNHLVRCQEYPERLIYSRFISHSLRSAIFETDLTFFLETLYAFHAHFNDTHDITAVIYVVCASA